MKQFGVGSADHSARKRRSGMANLHFDVFTSDVKPMGKLLIAAVLMICQA
jgi:hypothetical protein